MTDKSLNFLKEQTLIDKSSWDRGEWDNEPDRIYWIDSKTGYHCIIRRIKFGFLCGYVAIKKNHPFYGKSYNDIDSILKVHGGVTYSEFCNHDHEMGIRLLTEEKDKSWWFGFDCGHFLDYQPAFSDTRLKELLPKKSVSLFGQEIYRNISYVISETESLAQQLKDLEND
jgi:hypothetical protein